MNAATLKRLAVLLAGLVVIWLGVWLWRAAHRDADRSLRLTRFDPKTADEVTIARPADTLRFRRKAGAWSVNGHAADGSMVNELLGALSDTSARSELVAETTASHRRLGLDSATARRVSVLRAGATVTQLLVGKPGDVYGTSLVRKPGDVRSYDLEGQLANLVARPQDDWRDKLIVRVPAESVAAITVRRGTRSYGLKREGKAWRLGGAPADSAAVARLLVQLRDLEAAGFPSGAQAESTRFVPGRAVQVSDSAGRTLADLRMDSLADAVWVRRAGDSVTYRIDAWTADQLAPADSVLRARKKK